MSGILSFFESPVGQGLLAAGFGALAGRGNRAQAIGQGGLLGLQAFGQAKDDIAQRERRAKQDKLFDVDIAQREAAMQADQRRAQQETMRSNYLSADGKVTSPQVGAQPNAVDPRKMLQLGFTPEFISTYMNAGNLGKAKIKEFKEIRNPDGSVSVVGFDEYGNVSNTNQTPYKAPDIRDFGGYVGGIDPITGKVSRLGNKTMTPGEAASNSLGWANNALSRQRLALDQQQAQQARPEFREGQWVVPPRDMKPGEARSVAPGAASRDATEALNIIEQARKILPGATGSYAGAAADQVARTFGSATDGAKATAQLQALEGALVSKMPKMSGPQSDKDVLLYKQMAGVIGDPTVPVEQRTAALDVIEQIQRRYAGQPQAQQPAPTAQPKRYNPATGRIE